MNIDFRYFSLFVQGEKVKIHIPPYWCIGSKSVLAAKRRGLTEGTTVDSRDRLNTLSKQNGPNNFPSEISGVDRAVIFAHPMFNRIDGFVGLT